MATKKRAAPAKRAAAAKKVAADILAAQRRDIADARDLCRTLVAELRSTGEESAAIDEGAAIAPEIDKKRKMALAKEATLAGRAAILHDLAGITRTLIELERHAFDLTAAEESDAAPNQPSAVDSIAERIARLTAPDEQSIEL